MAATLPGYCGAILEVNLSTGKIEKKPLNEADVLAFGGGRGLGAKMLWDRLSPGADALAPATPLMFLTGPYSGFPVPCASRTAVVTKSALTSPLHSKLAHASTLAYSNLGGFFAPELKFAGYDALVVTGKAAGPVYLVIDGDKVDVRDAKKFWGKGTDAVDKLLPAELGDKRFQSVYIGPAGEKLVRYATIMHTASRAAGRCGTGCVMGSKKRLTRLQPSYPLDARDSGFEELPVPVLYRLSVSSARENATPSMGLGVGLSGGTRNIFASLTP
ncbi:MAG: hypothetical protein HQK82_13960 [Desulfovibrionaceae bacterium]|nr:hypothetical protein [Desulfovibrionaceae bacterium]